MIVYTYVFKFRDHAHQRFSWIHRIPTTPQRHSKIATPFHEKKRSPWFSLFSVVIVVMVVSIFISVMVFSSSSNEQHGRTKLLIEVSNWDKTVAMQCQIDCSHQCKWQHPKGKSVILLLVLEVKQKTFHWKITVQLILYAHLL